MMQALMQSFKTVFKSRSDISKASELVLVINPDHKGTDSDSPEFFVQKIIPYVVRRPNNPRVSDYVVYEFIGYVLKSSADGTIKVPAMLACKQNAFNLFRRGKRFVAHFVSEKKLRIAPAEPKGECQAACSSFEIDPYGTTKIILARGK